MRATIAVLILINFIIYTSNAQTQFLPRPTVYSDSVTNVYMSNNNYLQNLSGTYLVNNSGPETVVIRVSLAKKLLINLPGQGEYELKAFTPELFDIEGLPKVRILVFLDRLGRSRAITITDEREGTGSRKRQVGAMKKGNFKD